MSTHSRGCTRRNQVSLIAVCRGLGVLLSLVLVAWLVHRADLRAVLRMLARTNPWWLCVGCGFYLASSVARAYRLLRLGHLPLRRIGAMTQVVLAVSLANQILPFRLGEITYVYLARKSEGMVPGKSLASVLAARLFDMLAIAVLFVVEAGVMLRQLPPPSFTYLTIALAAAVLIGGIIAALAVWHARLSEVAHLLIARLTFLAPGVTQSLNKLAEDLTDAFGTMGSAVRCAHLMLSSLAVWATNFAMLHALLLGLGIPLAIWQTIIGATFAVLTGMLPVNSIGTFGTLEAGWTMGFVLMGLDMTLAVSSGFATHLLALGYSAAMGGVAWISLEVAARCSHRPGPGDSSGWHASSGGSAPPQTSC